MILPALGSFCSIERKNVVVSCRYVQRAVHNERRTLERRIWVEDAGMKYPCRSKACGVSGIYLVQIGEACVVEPIAVVRPVRVGNVFRSGDGRQQCRERKDADERRTP